MIELRPANQGKRALGLSSFRALSLCYLIELSGHHRLGGPLEAIRIPSQEFPSG